MKTCWQFLIRNYGIFLLAAGVLFIWLACALNWPVESLADSVDPLIKQAQQCLQEWGYNPGTVDGKIGDKTITALKKFQQDHQLPDTGKLDAATRKKLGLSGQNPASPPSTSPSDTTTFPKVTSWMNDYTGTLTSEEKQELDRLLEDFETATSHQVFVVIMQNLPRDFTLEEYVNELFERWQPGQKGVDNGVLLAVFLNNRKLRIEVGYGLEASLTDAACKLIITYDIAPAFQHQQYFQGIKNGLISILGTIQGTYAPHKPRRPITLRTLAEWTLIGCFVGLSSVIVIASLLRAALRPFASKSRSISKIVTFLESYFLPQNPIAKFLAGVLIVLTATGLLLFLLPENDKFWAIIFLFVSPFLIIMYYTSSLKFLLIAPVIFVIVFLPLYLLDEVYRYIGIGIFVIVLFIIGGYQNVKAGFPWHGRSDSSDDRDTWTSRSSDSSAHSQRSSSSRFHGGGGGSSGGSGASGSW
ncbi:hypothetical protein U27_03060 [Candidatus Vecturithrix granuli]|uniref:TPM domain-containing protein n=1 Tax=Vecturithrix granuli TaxID=1499967 RepID=A0A081BUU3_VECG1|nr:hypothetical protein U27_03060 [Candidatus Vecturithrix granuli]